MEANVRDDLYSMYEKQGISREMADAAVEFVDEFLRFETKEFGGDQIDVGRRSSMPPDSEPQRPKAETEIVREFLAGRSGELTSDDVLALGRYFYLTGQTGRYIYITSIAGREGILSELGERTRRICGTEVAERVFEGLAPPNPGTPPPVAVPVTAAFVERLSQAVDDRTARKVLAGNMHGIPREAFAAEKEAFERAGSLVLVLRGIRKAEIRPYLRRGDGGGAVGIGDRR